MSRGIEIVLLVELSLQLYLFLYSTELQTNLVRSCWCELFVLGLAQHADTLSLFTILTAIINHLQNSVAEGMPCFCIDINLDSYAYRSSFRSSVVQSLLSGCVAAFEMLMRLY